MSDRMIGLSLSTLFSEYQKYDVFECGHYRMNSSSISYLISEKKEIRSNTFKQCV